MNYKKNYPEERRKKKIKTRKMGVVNAAGMPFTVSCMEIAHPSFSY